MPGNMTDDIDKFKDFMLITAPSRHVSNTDNLAQIIKLKGKLEDIGKLLTKKNEEIDELSKIKDAYKLIKIERDSLLGRIKEIENQGTLDDRPIALSSFSSKIIDEFEKTDIANQGRNYRLANVTLNLKTLVTKDSNDQLGIQLLPWDKVKEINRDMMSEVHMEFSPGPPRTDVSLNVPDLVGLTETAARRVLDHLGLKLNPVYQENDKVQGGDSFMQAPDPGSKIMPNDYITVIFCKK